MKNRQSYRHIVKRLKKFDWVLMLNVLIMAFISMIFVYSATRVKHGNSFLIKEGIWVALGSLAFITASFIDYKKYAKFSKVIYIGNLIMLIAVLIFGSVINGAKSWILIGPFQVQPSEFAKVFILLSLCELLAYGMPSGVKGWKGILKCAIHVLIPVILILKQPDFGSAMVFMFLLFVLIYLHDVHLGPFLFIIGSGIVMIPIGYFFLLKDYQKDRINMFLNHLFLKIDEGKMDKGYQVYQSIVAIGSGGLNGKGIFQGSQNKLQFLPEPQTDFIFSVILEETGFIGGMLIVMLFGWLLYKIISIGQRAEDIYGQLICYGAAAIIFVHTLVNMGMVMGVMPVTGIPLLLISYGGSSFVASFLMLGIVNSVKIHGTSS